jgi:hypothetical protein
MRLKKMKLIGKLIGVVVVLMAMGIYPIISNAKDNPNIEEMIENVDSYNGPLGFDVMPIDETIKEFEEKVNLHVLKPTYLPFEPTHKGAIMTANSVRVHYYNEITKERLKIYLNKSVAESKNIAPFEEDVYLSDGTKAIYFYVDKGQFEGLTFVINGVHYIVAIEDTDGDEKEKLIKVANSLK